MAGTGRGCGRSRTARALLVIGIAAGLSLGGAPAAGDVAVEAGFGTDPIDAVDLGDGTDFRIPHTAGRLAAGGSDLFHSFTEFNLAPADIATFLGPGAVDRIYGRIGHGPSFVHGTVRTDAGLGAVDLYLVNPNGILIGPSASIDVNGSFFVTSADELRFDTADGTQRFVATPGGEVPLLAVAPPEAFGFLSENPAPVLSQAPIQLPAGETLAFIGGDLQIGPAAGAFPDLIVPDGNIHLVSVASSGDVLANPAGWSQAPILDGFDALGSIEVTDAFVVTGSVFDLGPPVGNVGGPVFIRGGRFHLRNGLVQSDAPGLDPVADPPDPDAPLPGVDVDVTGDVVLDGFSRITSQSLGRTRGRDIRIRAEALTVTGGSSIESRLGALVPGQDGQPTVIATGGAPGGDIDVEVERLTLDTGAIRSANVTANPSGDLHVVARETALVTGSIGPSEAGGFLQFPAAIVMLDLATFDPGELHLEVGDLSVTGGGQIEASIADLGLGRPGARPASVRIEATGSVFVGGRASGALGNTVPGSAILSDGADVGPGGAVSLTAASLTLDDGGIRAVTFAPGTGTPAGTVDLDVAGDVELRNGSFLSSTNFGGSDAGSIRVQAANLEMSGGSIISSRSQPAPGLRGGAAGTVDIDVENRVDVTNSTIGTIAENATRGGDIDVRGRALTFKRSAVTARTLDPQESDAGSIRLEGTDTVQLVRTVVTAESSNASGGNIEIIAGQRIDIVDSQVLSSALRGTGNGGNVTIDPELVVIQGSEILARADAGRGGDILIVGDNVLIDPTSRIDASSRTGIDGTVRVEQPENDISKELTTLPTEVVSAAELLREGCAARGEPGGSFRVSGRGGVPAGHDGYLPAFLPDREAPGEPGPRIAGVRIGTTPAGEPVFVAGACGG